MYMPEQSRRRYGLAETTNYHHLTQRQKNCADVQSQVASGTANSESGARPAATTDNRFWITLSGKGRYPLLHFGMTGMIQVSHWTKHLSNSSSGDKNRRGIGEKCIWARRRTHGHQR